MSIDATAYAHGTLYSHGAIHLPNGEGGGPVVSGLGFWALTSPVVGNVIGSSIFVLPSLLAPFGLAWLS